MNRDDFIIAVYCLVCEHYQAVCAALPHRLRRGGFDPQLSDQEVITIEVCDHRSVRPSKCAASISR
jgi:hypothetical protein